MRLMSLKQAEKLLENALAAKADATEITVFTFKKDRLLGLYRQVDQLRLLENGYGKSQQSFTIEQRHECRHALKAALKVEFPRSRQVYVNVRK
ncbi:MULTISPECIES: hypothetical protein [Lactobacillaceae]|nr:MULTISPECIES: hypothetical protein [Lactobacillaceae]AMV70367.1 Hypothetical protein ADU73_2041 [Pediococcus damnosus]MBZ3798713.1 hypothetical protein [Lacticaseibacillus paracasei]